MKKILLAILIVLSTFSSGWAGPISNEIVLKAITIFERSPLSDDGEGAAAIISRFAEESDNIYIEISMELVPWLGDGESAPYYHQRIILLAAYLAGNVKSQIHNNKALDDPYSGLLQTLKTYKQLQQADLSFTLPEIEKIKTFKDNNQLKTHVGSITNKTP